MPTTATGTVVQTNHYYPYGMTFAEGIRISRQPYKFGGKEKESWQDLGSSDFGARIYQPALCEFDSGDPMMEEYYSWSIYGYCLGNPLKYVDPTGAWVNPIYDPYGNFLGTDDLGLRGDPIFMSKSHFTQGMPHEEAEEYNLGWGEALYTFEDFERFFWHYHFLPQRPDYDGYLTKAEADKWWNNKSGQPLFVDQSKIELHGVNTNFFKDSKTISKNFIWRLTNTGQVYGTLDMTLIDAKTGIVRIGYAGYDYMDKYDFEMDGRPGRDFATRMGRPGGPNDGVDFIIHGYGYTKIPAVTR
jgi:RHS repeat-associated protein